MTPNYWQKIYPEVVMGFLRATDASEYKSADLHSFAVHCTSACAYRRYEVLQRIWTQFLKLLDQDAAVLSSEINYF